MNIVQKQYAFWPSVVRIIATFLIFYFHFGGLTGAYPVTMLDRFAILLFLLISGFFAYPPHGNELRWLERRFKHILFPYWPIVLTAIITNHVINYKDSTLLHDVLVFFGFSLFLENPIYIISWFITLILFFYLNLFLFRLIKNKLVKTIFWVLSFYLFYAYFKVSAFYYVSFYLGYFLRSRNFLINEPYLNTAVMKNVNNLIFKIQSYCYVFFLLHGAIILFHVKVLQWSNPVMFVSAFLSSGGLTYIYKQIVDRTIMRIKIG